MSESHNSCYLSWLMKSYTQIHIHSCSSTLSSLPDDLLLECLSRVPPPSLQSLSAVCRRWAHLLDSPSFLDLRRRHGRIHTTVFAVSATDFGLNAAFRRFEDDVGVFNWKVSSSLANDAVSLGNFHGLLSHARLSAVGSGIFIISRNAMVRFDTWNGTVVARSAMLFPRQKFATAVVSGKIYAAGGGSRTDAVEEYDPNTDTWRVVCQAPRRRYDCIGTSVDGVFYVIGGTAVGTVPRAAANAEAHVYASSMDLYDVEARAWLRSRAVPGGGCVVAACSAAGHVYVLASHAEELSFWKFDARREKTTTQNSNNSTAVTNAGFGEWCRLESPPLPQVRVGSTVRFSCVGVENKVVLVQVRGCIDDLLRWTGRNLQGLREGLVLVYDSVGGEWSRGPYLPKVIRRAAACVCVEF